MNLFAQEIQSTLLSFKNSAQDIKSVFNSELATYKGEFTSLSEDLKQSLTAKTRDQLETTGTIITDWRSEFIQWLGGL